MASAHTGRIFCNSRCHTSRLHKGEHQRVHFYLTDEEMAQMRSLNKEKRFINMDYKQAEKFVLNWKLDD